MKSLANYVLGVLGFASLGAASDVHDLKQDTFDTFMKEHDLVLAEFFAPWCGHCKALAPEYEEAATQLKEKDIALAKVDCTVEQELCSAHGVEGYPTLKIFRSGNVVAPYGGQRKAQAIVSYMIKQAMPAVSVLDKDSLEEFKTADKVVLVGYFAADDKASNETFTELANIHRDTFLFGAISDASIAEAEGVKQPGVVLYKAFDEGKNIHDGDFTKDALDHFTKTASVPIIGEIGPETYAGYMSAGIPLAYIFAEEVDERQKLAEELRSVAIKHKGKVNFAVIDAKAFGQHAGNLNLEVGKWPAFVIQDPSTKKKFPYPQDHKITEAEIGKYMDDFAAGKIEPSIKSEPIPETQDGPVTVIVANNYKDIIMDDSKDVLVEYYAPWCGHCKALAPKYEELGALYKDNEEFNKLVIVAKVDATANDIPEDISGFPTIKLFPAGKKSEVVDFNGARNVEDLANFIRDSGSHKVDAWASRPVEGESSTATASGGAADSVKEAVKSGASKAAEAVKVAVGDSEDNAAAHDEL